MFELRSIEPVTTMLSVPPSATGADKVRRRETGLAAGAATGTAALDPSVVTEGFAESDAARGVALAFLPVRSVPFPE
ncbi:hypothetical protein AA21291_1604 [Swaminathania salitolerans LMG 21291]|nr:hypothetical protein AA21291_1604 [Swaminathania salitolerans LMG 21291]